MGAEAGKSDREQKGRHSFLIEKKSHRKKEEERQTDETHSLIATHKETHFIHTPTNTQTFSCTPRENMHKPADSFT